jgi:serine/threonine protein phosphatase 1
MTDDLSTVGDGVRVYIIGDIHGRSDLLDSMIDQIHGDFAKNKVRDCLTITLGDYVDRGPDSRGVLDRLAQNPFPWRYIALKGNHELLFETFLRDPSVGQHWRGLGGLETLHSYGIHLRELLVGKGFERAAAALSAAVPTEHLEFLHRLKPCWAMGGYFFCHAGIRPGVAFERQRIEDLLWIRDEFLNSTLNFGKMVVHGHSPCDWPDVRSNRVNIDTGAFATGRLTCLVLEGGEGRFLYTG